MQEMFIRFELNSPPTFLEMPNQLTTYQLIEGNWLDIIIVSRVNTPVMNYRHSLSVCLTITNYYQDYQIIRAMNE